MNFWMAPDLPQVCLRLHMSAWTVHPQQTSGDSVAKPDATVTGLQQTKHIKCAKLVCVIQILICVTRQKRVPEDREELECSATKKVKEEEVRREESIRNDDKGND